MNSKVFSQALKEKRLVKFLEGPKLVKKELTVAKMDLKVAKKSLVKKESKWATIQGYYAMYHAARALIYSRKLKEKTHYHLLVAVKVLFVDEYLLSKEMIEELQESMGLREKADYESDYSLKGAKYVVKTAEDFINKTRELLEN